MDAVEQSVVGRWTVVATIGEEELPLAVEQPPTLEFDDGGSVFVYTGCNRGRGSYQYADGTLTLGPVALTRMLCMGERGDLESAVLRVIGNTDAIRADLDSDVLTLTNGDHGLVLNRAEAEPTYDI